MELLAVLGLLTVVAALALLGFGVDSRDNQNWNPAQPVRTR